MSWQSLTWGKRLELAFGAIIPTVFMVPILLLGIAWSGLLLFGMFAAGGTYAGGIFFFSVVAVAFGIGAVLSLWVLVLRGPEWITRRPGLKWFAVVNILIGLAFGIACLHHRLVLGYRRNPLKIEGPFWDVLIEALFEPAILGAFFVWLKSLPKLLRRVS